MQDEEDRGARRAVVLCGPGNNGGDGFVIARLLAGLDWDVTVFLYGDADRLPPDARANYERWVEIGDVNDLSETLFRDTHADGFADIYVDALFGTGLTRALADEAFAVLRHMSGVDGDDYTPRVVAVDAPSGLCLDSGRVLHPAPFGDRLAALTVTFHAPKVGHYIGGGPASCGKIVIKDIGLTGRAGCDLAGRAPFADAGPTTVQLVARVPGVQGRSRVWQNWVFGAVLKGRGNAHKYSYGHALVLSGASGKTGAARLAARGALRIGAGLVTLGVPHAALAEAAAQVTSIMLSPIDDAKALNAALEDDRLNAVCIGPGFGLQRAREMVPHVLASGRACVLDADALSAYREDPAHLFSLLHDRCVLTPHGGEFALLFPDIAEKLYAPAASGPAYSKVDATRAAAARAGCTVLFKGPDTIIAHAEMPVGIHSATRDRSVPWLSTAGAGDVLAGFITGLLARGLHPARAASVATWLHVECARSFGPGLIAEDLADELPKVFRQLENVKDVP